MGSLKSNDYFSRDPRVRIRRSRFDQSHPHKATWNNGSLIPLWVTSILPGDTVDAKLTSVVRMSTPVKPIMDNVFMDTFWFFVPYRLVWSHWEEFMGANKNGYWTPAVEYQEPHINFPKGDDATQLGRVLTLVEWSSKGIKGYSYLDSGVETTVQMPVLLHDMFMRGCLARYYQPDPLLPAAWHPMGTLTWDQFADQFGLSDVRDGQYGVWGEGWSVGSLADYMADPVYSNTGSVSALKYRGYCLIYNEYFRDQNYMNPVNTDRDVDSDIDGLDYQSYNSVVVGHYDPVTDTVKGSKPLQVCRFHDYFSSCLPQPQKGDAVSIPLSGSAPVFDAGGASVFTPKFYTSSGNVVSSPFTLGSNGSSGLSEIFNSPTFSYTTNMSMSADLSKIVSPATINDLRTAFQLQKFEETYARAGGLYKTIIQSFFGVDNNDARLQRPEYLGGSRHFLNVTQVLQTSATDEVSPQGNTAAYSLTVEKEPAIVKSFTEHGLLYCMAVCRTSRSYQNGLNRLWTKRRKYDHYFPVFAHLGEQSVLLKEIYNRYGGTVYAKDDSDLDTVFGYQERYAEYRYFPATVSGDFRSDSPQSLDFWHFADDYIDAPIMSEGWLLEGPENLDRCLAVTSKLSHQYLGDFYFDVKFTRPMPLYSIPGLADHF